MLRQTLLDYCNNNGRKDLLEQWHPSQNGAFTPVQAYPGSHKMAWWLCSKGHSWQATIKSRVEGNGCPYCANLALLPGVNDLATVYPELAKQWHPAKNAPLTPREVAAGSRRKVWWKCDQGHEWQAAIFSRTAGTGCPVCAGRVIVPGVNDLAHWFPQIADQWNSGKNGGLRPDAVSPNSNRKVWWICEAGHEYAATVASRTVHGSGCPYCAGKKVLPGFNDLATVEPKVAAQWHPDLNGALTPEMVTAGSRRMIWWQCAEGHVWKTAVYSRTGPQKCGCPVCSGRVRVRPRMT